VNRFKWLPILVAGILAYAGTDHAYGQDAHASPIADLVQADLERLGAELRSNQNGVTQYQRDEAARRLLARRTPQGQQIIIAALVDVNNPSAQLAAARALAANPDSDPALITPLFALFGPNRPLCDAAAQALTVYKAHPTVLNRLIELARNPQQPETVRLATVKALGSFPEKRAAEVLITLLVEGTEPVAVRQTAGDALVEMTGLRMNGREVRQWQQWWADHAAQPETEWRAELLQSRSLRYDQAQLRHAQLTQELQALLSEQYRAAPDPSRLDILLRYIRSSEPEVRVVGARMIHEDFNARDRIVAPAARAAIREMIGDSSPAVRMEVAQVLRAMNDPEALDPLLAQLAQEPEGDVRAALARALAPIQDLRAAPILIVLLQDESTRAAEAAALALRDLGPLLKEHQPQLAAQAARELRALVERQPAGVRANALREAAVEAMVPLREPTLFSTFVSLLRPNEPVAIRRHAVRGLGELRDPRLADTIVRVLDDPREDASVRLAAVDALGRISTFEQAGALYRRLDPQNEPSEAVRERAWLILESLFPHADEAQLAEWADRFQAQPQRRLTILRALARKYQDARREEALAIVRQTIGETLMQTNDFSEAAVFFKLALDYWQERRIEGMHTEGLIERRMTALLRSRQYPEAISFASAQIARDRAQQQTMGRLIRQEAERLRDADDPGNALALIHAAQGMEPPLPEPYAGNLNTILRDIQQDDRNRTAPANQGPQSDGTRTVALELHP
jgi:HEAT repeat protein